MTNVTAVLWFAQNGCSESMQSFFVYRNERFLKKVNWDWNFCPTPAIHRIPHRVWRVQGDAL